MADLFYIALIIWVLWKIFGGTTRHTVHHRHSYEEPKKTEGEVTISQTKVPPRKSADEGEYVDFEEIK